MSAEHQDAIPYWRERISSFARSVQNWLLPIPDSMSGCRTDDVSIAGVAGAVMRGWRFILLCILICTIASVMVSLNKPKMYSASMRITPRIDQTSQSGGAATSVLGALTGSQQASSRTFTQMLNLLHSNRVAAFFLNDRGRIRHIFGPNWVYRDGRWISLRSPGFSGRLKSSYLSIFGISVDEGPSIPNIYRYLAGAVSTLQASEGQSVLGASSSSQIVTVSAVDNTPEGATSLLIQAVKAADTILKESERQNLQRRIAYLSDRLATVSIVEYRTSLVNVLSEQERYAMMIDDAGYYSLFVLDDPVIDAVPISPEPILNLAIGAMLGLVLGSLFILFRDGKSGRLG